MTPDIFLSSVFEQFTEPAYQVRCASIVAYILVDPILLLFCMFRLQKEEEYS
jgi:hypothetical protein